MCTTEIIIIVDIPLWWFLESGSRALKPEFFSCSLSGFATNVGSVLCGQLLCIVFSLSLFLFLLGLPTLPIIMFALAALCFCIPMFSDRCLGSKQQKLILNNLSKKTIQNSVRLDHTESPNESMV